jgi:protein phosphatase
LNSFGINSIIVAEETHQFAGLCLPVCLTFLDAPRAEMIPAGVDCRYASPEVQGYSEYSIGPAADVYTLAVLTFYLMTGVPPRDLMECNFCPVENSKDLGPYVRECLEDALAIYPARRPYSAGQFVERLRKALVQDLCRLGPAVCIASKTDIGIGGRDTNEDACGVCMRSASDARGRYQFGVAAVADGMGGSAFGERASAFCIERLLEDVAGNLRLLGGALATPEDWSRACREWILQLNREVIELGKRLGAPHDVGSTLTAVLFAGRRAFLLHTGDSRLYLLRSGNISQLTRSQTYAEQLHAEGQLTREEVERSIYRSVLTSYVGSRKCDPQVEELHLVAGDTLVLCTDGLMEGLKEHDIRDIAGHLPPAEAVTEMVHRCKTQLQTQLSDSHSPERIPCSDNMTVVVVQLLEEPGDEQVMDAPNGRASSSGEPATTSQDLSEKETTGGTHA